ncbi:MOSC domain-containing protein [candidate division WOR-3 bacterium]|nr:MOSC domain-containing protein [candidate division WOR-3 bacterium]
MKKYFFVLSVNVSNERGTKKTPVDKIVLKKNWGIQGDAHAGKWHRQVTLLAIEDINEIAKERTDITFGDFAENITTKGAALSNLPIGTEIHLGKAVLKVTQIGKKEDENAIKKLLGISALPKKGVFAEVMEEGEIDSESICYYDI